MWTTGPPTAMNSYPLSAGQCDEAQKAMDYSVNNKADIVKAVIRIAE